MRALLLVSVAVVSLVAVAFAQEESALTDADRRAFAWYDRLGLPSMAHKQFVRVDTGWTWTDEHGEERHHVVEGFMLEETADSVLIQRHDLFLERFPRKVGRSPGATFEPIDFETSARARLTELGEALRRTDEESALADFPGPELPARMEPVVTARHCAERGLDRLAHEFLEMARDCSDRAGEKDVEEPLERVMERELDTPLIWRHTLAFGEPSVSRAQLFAAFRTFGACFPSSRHAPRAKEAADILERMVREDEERARAPPPEGDLPREERIADLIRRLRDAPGEQPFQPGIPCFDDEAAGAPTPFAELVGLGHDAVPQLISALDDTRFTRCVGFHRNFYFSHYVLRVGDAAVRALERISGRTFKSRWLDPGPLGDPEKVLAVRARVESWWNSVKSKGETAVLVEAVEAGGMDASRALVRLLERDPDAAARAAVVGLQKAHGAARINLLESVRKVPGDDVTAYLARMAREDPDLASRAKCGAIALERGCADAVPAMIELWEATRHRSPPGPFVREQIVHALVRCGSLDAIAAVGKDLDTCDPSVAGEVANAAGMQLRFLPKLDGYPESALRAVEDLVASLLLDRRTIGDITSAKGSVSRRVCDVAAEQLAIAWREPFELFTEQPDRDLRIAHLRALWRERRGLPPDPSEPR